jgi:hypothetical protein
MSAVSCRARRTPTRLEGGVEPATLAIDDTGETRTRLRQFGVGTVNAVNAARAASADALVAASTTSAKR